MTLVTFANQYYASDQLYSIKEINKTVIDLEDSFVRGVKYL